MALIEPPCGGSFFCSLEADMAYGPLVLRASVTRRGGLLAQPGSGLAHRRALWEALLGLSALALLRNFTKTLPTSLGSL